VVNKHIRRGSELLAIKDTNTQCKQSFLSEGIMGKCFPFFIAGKNSLLGQTLFRPWNLCLGPSVHFLEEYSFSKEPC
jgi:hypothetical protein